MTQDEAHKEFGRQTKLLVKHSSRMYKNDYYNLLSNYGGLTYRRIRCKAEGDIFIVKTETFAGVHGGRYNTEVRLIKVLRHIPEFIFVDDFNHGIERLRKVASFADLEQRFNDRRVHFISAPTEDLIIDLLSTTAFNQVEFNDLNPNGIITVW